LLKKSGNLTLYGGEFEGEVASKSDIGFILSLRRTGMRKKSKRLSKLMKREGKNREVKYNDGWSEVRYHLDSERDAQWGL